MDENKKLRAFLIIDRREVNKVSDYGLIGTPLLIWFLLYACSMEVL